MSAIERTTHRRSHGLQGQPDALRIRGKPAAQASYRGLVGLIVSAVTILVAIL